MSSTVTPARAEFPRVVTKRDLDREIERLLEELARDCSGGETVARGRGLRPRWILASELVRRVLPFTSDN